MGQNLIVDGELVFGRKDASLGSCKALWIMRCKLLQQHGRLDLSRGRGNSADMIRFILDPPTISEIIEMALSDHVSFDQIRTLQGLGPEQVKALMRQNLKSGSYRAWRKRVRQFADRREVYK
jgi:uncharacterized protein (TIGR03643 family)